MFGLLFKLERTVMFMIDITVNVIEMLQMVLIFDIPIH